MHQTTQPLIKLDGPPIDTSDGFRKAEEIQKAAARSVGKVAVSAVEGHQPVSHRGAESSVEQVDAV